MTSPAPTPPRASSSVNKGRLALIAVLLVALAGGVYAYFYYTNRVSEMDDQTKALRSVLENRGKYSQLASDYEDKNQDLIADTPTDPAKWIDPAELLFTEVAGDDPEKLAATWEPFRQHLEAKTGKKVRYLKQLDMEPNPEPMPNPAPMPNPEPKLDPRDQDPDAPPQPIMVRDFTQQIELIKQGRLHIAAFSTGQLPMAVNAAGFVPLAAPATADNTYTYKMQVIVPADSPVSGVKELAGKTVALVSLSSNSGGKAPIVRFQEKFGLNAAKKDYQFAIAGRHETAIFGVCVGREAAPILANARADAQSKTTARAKPGAKYDAACVASDILARLVENGEIKASDFRVIHEEGPFPVLCFGIPHNLKPELAGKIKEAFLTYTFTGSVADKYKASKQVKFAAVDYRKDWAAVREIDDKLPVVIEAK